MQERSYRNDDFTILTVAITHDVSIDGENLTGAVSEGVRGTSYTQPPPPPTHTHTHIPLPEGDQILAIGKLYTF